MATKTVSAGAQLPVSIDDVRTAHGRIADAIVRTPTLVSKTLSDLTGATVYLKFENLQFTAAYKERGALNTLLQLSPEACATGVIAASAGNHAQGLAYHANRLGVPATIVMPRTAPITKIVQTEGHRATVVIEGETYDAAYAHARLLEAERGRVTKGSIRFQGDAVQGQSPSDLVRRGCIQVMEGRHCFGHLTVEENLLTGAYTRRDGRAAVRADLERVYGYFPRLRARRGALAKMRSFARSMTASREAGRGARKENRSEAIQRRSRSGSVSKSGSRGRLLV